MESEAAELKFDNDLIISMPDSCGNKGSWYDFKTRRIILRIATAVKRLYFMALIHTIGNIETEDLDSFSRRLLRLFEQSLPDDYICIFWVSKTVIRTFFVINSDIGVLIFMVLNHDFLAIDSNRSIMESHYRKVVSRLSESLENCPDFIDKTGEFRVELHPSLVLPKVKKASIDSIHFGIKHEILICKEHFEMLEINQASLDTFLLDSLPDTKFISLTDNEISRICSAIRDISIINLFFSEYTMLNICDSNEYVSISSLNENIKPLIEHLGNREGIEYSHCYCLENNKVFFFRQKECKNIQLRLYYNYPFLSLETYFKINQCTIDENEEYKLLEYLNEINKRVFISKTLRKKEGPVSVLSAVFSKNISVQNFNKLLTTFFYESSIFYECMQKFYPYTYYSDGEWVEISF